MEIPANNNNTDEDLDELLDSCLDDFNRPFPKSAPSHPETSSASCSSKSEAKDLKADVKDSDALNWGEEFKQFQNVMENFLDNESEVDELKNLMSSFNENSLNDLDPTFLDAIKDLTEGAQNLPSMNPDMLEDLFKNLDVNDQAQANQDEMPEIMPFMQNLMQKLMSKELLYPSLKDIVEKYPKWLESNASSLKSQDQERYEEQFKLMKSVCQEFEKECDESNEEAKRARFEKVLALMQKIQNFGNPPKELIADLEHSAPLDEHGNLQIPGMPQQCSIM